MSARAEAAGKKGACPSCQAVMEIPVDSLEGKLAAIREGKAIVLITKAERHQANSAEYCRFRCRVCDHGLSIPTDKAHKKIQCTSCDAVSRLGLNVLDLQAKENWEMKPPVFLVIQPFRHAKSANILIYKRVLWNSLTII